MSIRRIAQISRIMAVVIIFTIAFVGCSGHKEYARRPVITEERDNEPIPKPKYREIGLYEDGLENVAGRPVKDFFNLSAHYRKLTNNHKQAKNVNALQEVPNSTWFTNRHAMKRMTIEELKHGPNLGSGPAKDGEWTVVGAKVEGVSPGFTIKDARGDVYFLKFDLKGYPQLSTASEVISTKFVYAIGYNTPENYLAVLDPKRLRLGEGVTYENKYLRDVPMTEEDVRLALDKAHQSADGTYRVVASKRLPGKPVGPFKYAGSRGDDKNDHIPHNHRREMRGYKVVSAWLNNIDSKANNTLDMYIEEDGKHFVKHYIIDFATSLGAGGRGPASARRGVHGAADVGNMIVRALTLGFYVEPYERKLGSLTSPSVGYFGSELYDPGDFATIIPNPAFVDATELDGFWGAKMVMSFTDEDIRAIVETGEYESKSDEEHVIKVLIERRDKTGRFWFKKVNPLDNFRIDKRADSRFAIAFDDLSVICGFARAEQTTYRYKLRRRGKSFSGYAYSKGESRLILNSDKMNQAIEGLSPKTTDGVDADRLFSVRIETQRGKSGYGKHVDVYFYVPPKEAGMPEIVALDREN